MALTKSRKIAGSHVVNTTVVNDSGCDVSRCNEISKPLHGEWIIFVIIGIWNRHFFRFRFFGCSTSISGFWISIMSSAALSISCR